LILSRIKNVVMESNVARALHFVPHRDEGGCSRRQLLGPPQAMSRLWRRARCVSPAYRDLKAVKERYKREILQNWSAATERESLTHGENHAPKVEMNPALGYLSLGTGATAADRLLRPKTTASFRIAGEL
jgi:hypothetical protein